MQEKDFRKFMVLGIITLLVILAFFILKPILLSIFFGIILAYLFHPLYERINRKHKRNKLSAFILVAGLLLIVLIPLIFLTPLISQQIFNAYLFLKNLDLTAFLQRIFPTFFTNPEVARDTATLASNFTSRIADIFLSIFRAILFNFPAILLQTAIVLFTFYFGIKDHDEISAYMKSILPFPGEYQQRFSKKFEQVTSSVLYGQLVVGFSQGIIAGIGYFAFGIPNAFILTIVTMLVGIIPIIGPWLVWIPIDIYLFTIGRTYAGTGLLIYGLFVINWVDTLVRPLIVGKRAKLNPGIALIGMVGGLFAFGILGLIIGPLVLAYLLLFLELYRESRVKSILFEQEKKEKK